MPFSISSSLIPSQNLQHTERWFREEGSFCANRVGKGGCRSHPSKGLTQSQGNSWTITQELRTTSAGALYGVRRARELETYLPQTCPQIPRFFLWSPLTHPDMGVGTVLIAGRYSFGHKSYHRSQPGTGTRS